MGLFGLLLVSINDMNDVALEYLNSMGWIIEDLLKLFW